MAERKLKVLIVDDEKIVRDFLTRILSLQLVESKAVEDGFTAIEAVKAEKFDLAFLDIRMPKMDGLKVYGELKRIIPDLNCVFMTGYALEESLLDKTNAGVICLKKPFQDINQIKEIVAGISKKIESPAAVHKLTLDKRIYSRLAIVLEVNYKVRGKQEFYSHSLSKDISPGGIRFLIEGQFCAGTILDLILKAPGTNNTCQAVAEVVWNNASADKPGYFDTGLKFNEVNLSDLAVLCGHNSFIITE